MLITWKLNLLCTIQDNVLVHCTPHYFANIKSWFSPSLPSPPLMQSGLLFVHLHDTCSTPFGWMERLQNFKITCQCSWIGQCVLFH